MMLGSEVRFFLAPPVRSSRFELDHLHVWGYWHIPPMHIGQLDLDVCRMSPRRLRGRRPFLGLEGRPVRRKGPAIFTEKSMAQPPVTLLPKRSERVSGLRLGRGRSCT